MKKLIFLSMLCFTFISLNAQQKQIWDETEQEKNERLAWWTNDRFGLFIHWGTYSLAARHEWVKQRERMTDETYQKYFDNFNPDLYNPGEWAKLAKAAGMKYAVITAKHHEGFTLFDSEYTDYKSTNTPYGKDALKEWVDAFREEGLKIGFFYSLLYWHHPEYTIDERHPQSANSDEAYKELNKDRDMNIYREYIKNQVTELLTKYGKVDILWLDYSFPGEHGKGREDWDFTTPEQFKIKEWPTYNGKRIPWETCQTFGDSWGYYRDELTWKDNKQLLVLLIESVSKGGNVLLNVGPTGRGTIDYRAEDALVKIGDWMKYNSRSIYGCTQAPDTFEVPDNSLLTYNPMTHRLYVHLLDYPLQNFTMKGMKGKIKYAQFLHDASEINVSAPKGHWIMQELAEGDINLSLPVNKPNIEIPVIEIILNTEK